MIGDRRGDMASVCGRRWIIAVTAAASGVAALALTAALVLKPSAPDTAARTEIAAASPSSGGGADTHTAIPTCDPATINQDNPAAGGIGPDCTYYPPIISPSSSGNARMPRSTRAPEQPVGPSVFSRSRCPVWSR